MPDEVKYDKLDAVIAEQIKKYWEEKLKRDRNEEKTPCFGGFSIKKMMKLQMLLN